MIFRNWVLQNFPFLEDDFDALTDYELFCKMIEYVKKLVKDNEDFRKQLEDLENYVYNLNLQDEVNNKLDEMASDGTLEEIMASYLNTKAIFGFDNVSGLKNATNLIDGSYAETLGYYTVNDNGGGLYHITDDELTPNDANIIELNSGLYAVLITKDNIITPEQFGCKGDGINNDTTNLQACIDYATLNKKQINFTGNYKVEPILQEDGTNLCLKIYRDSSDNSHVTDNNINFNFIRGSKIFTSSTDVATLIRINASNINFQNATLVGVQDKTTLLELSKIDKLSTTETQWTCYNIFRNLMLLSCKNAIYMEGNTYYNTFDKNTIRYCTNGIVLEMTALEKAGLENGSNVNRNDFTNTTIQQSTGKAIAIYYGDTNKFINVSLEGCIDGIYLDDPQQHTSDYEITPSFYTENNMFVNTVFEVVTGVPIYNNSGGLKMINPSVKYEEANNNFVIKPQTYIGAGANDANSIEKVMDIYKSLEDLPIPNTQKYSTIINSNNGHISKYYSDMQVNNGTYKVLSRRNQLFDETNITNLKADTSLTYESTYKCIVKQIGGIVFMSTKFSMQPSDVNSDIILPLHEDITANNQLYGNYDLGGMIIPIIVLINSTPTIVMCEFGVTQLKLKCPADGWSSTIQVYINTHWYRDTLDF